jgi:antitoxin HicB
MKTLDEYLALSYHYELVRGEPDEGGFVAFHPELEGCISQGETADEAVENLDDARDAWITTRFQGGLAIPEPARESDFSGKVLLRMSTRLHESLVRLARTEGVSLNQLLNETLARRVGEKNTESVLEKRSRLFSPR